MVKIVIGPSGKKLRIAWEPSDEIQYGSQLSEVVIENLKEKVKKIRNKADGFMRSWETAEIAQSSLNEWVRSSEIVEKMKIMAMEGFELFKLILPKEKHEVNCIYDYLNKCKRIRIRFNNMEVIPIPWTLLYGPGPAPDQVCENVLDYFWGSKFAVTVETVRSNTGAIPFLNAGGFFPLINEKDFCIQQESIESPEQKVSIEIYDRAPNVCNNEQSLPLRLNNLHKRISGKNILYYVYSHTVEGECGTEFQFATDHKHSLSPDHFSKILERQDDQGEFYNAFFFLNSCNSHTDSTLRAIIDGNGNGLGCIVTEAIVPKRFGMRFGMEFIDSWLQGSGKLIDVFSRIALKHLPISLLYTLYCWEEYTDCMFIPSFTMMDLPDQVRYRQYVEHINFSTDIAFIK